MTKKKSSSLSLRSKFKLSQLVQTLDGIDSIEALIQSKFKSDAPKLSEVSQYLFTLGGKRIRPVLCLLVAQALGMAKPEKALIEIAAGIELIHMATLLHDDIIDKSPLRRKAESPYMKFGTTDTLLSGDFLLVRAFSLCAHLDEYIINATEEACVELTEGEILELPLSAASITLEKSLIISQKKTAALFRLAAESATHIATKGKKSVVDAASRFGESLGIAFQIYDDILDVIGTEDELGKKVGIDIREQKPSPVNVFWLAKKTPLAEKLLGTSQYEVSDKEIQDGIKEILSLGVIDEARSLAQSYADSALFALQEMQEEFGYKLETTAAEALTGLVAFILERIH